MGRPTIFIDIDGTILKHQGTMQEIVELEPEILPGVQQKFAEWHDAGYIIIVITARDEEYRDLTKSHLDRFLLPYSQLIMGIGSGVRYLINDTKPYANLETTAFAHTVKRDCGLSDCDLQSIC